MTVEEIYLQCTSKYWRSVCWQWRYDWSSAPVVNHHTRHPSLPKNPV